MSDKKKKVIHSPKETNPAPVNEVKLLSAPRSLIHTPSQKPKSKRNLPHINTPMETHQFIFSQLAILFFALAFLAGMYWVLNNPTLQTKIAESGYLPVTLKQTSFGLEVKNPDDELLTFSNAIIISGSTSPKSSIIIASSGSTNFFDGLEADNEGTFQRTIPLSPGLNKVEISSFDRNGNMKTVTRTIFYSLEALQ
jgi:hypothetical protein